MLDLRALLTRAPESFRTISLQCEAEYRTAILQREMLRGLPNVTESDPPSTATFVDPSGDDATGADAPLRHEWNVWWRRPDCWRDDIVWATDQIAVCIVRGAASSFYLSSSGTLRMNTGSPGTIERLRSMIQTRQPGYLPSIDDRLSQMPLVRPAPLANGWELSELGEREYAGRTAIAVHATRLGQSSPFGLWSYINEYDLLVDRERGVLLRCAGMVGRAEAGVLAVRYMTFDEPVSDEIFAFEPPPGTRTLIDR